ncbi:MAG: toprim domain-containing protein [Raineya sp.]|jgi:DNA primase|nr:toprim domain-containing protein [Raineya sp.]
MIDKDEIKKIREYPIEQYLAYEGFQPQNIRHNHGYGGLEYWYNSPLHDERTPSFKVNEFTNTWADFGLSGTNTAYMKGNIIDFVMQYKNKSFIEALQDISSVAKLELRPIVQEPSVEIEKQFEQKRKEASYLIQKEQPLQNKALLDYIKERKISEEVAKKYCKEVYWQYEGKDIPKHAFGISLKNESNALEVSNRYGKYSLGAKDITVIKTQNEHAQKNGAWIIFEGKYDFMAYMTEKKYHEPPSNVIILNSISLTQRAIQYLQNEQAQKVLLCADFDEGGDRCTLDFQKTFQKNCYDMRVTYQGYKDYNDKLLDKKLHHFALNEQKEIKKQAGEFQSLEATKEPLEPDKTIKQAKPWEMTYQEYQKKVEDITKAIQENAYKQRSGAMNITEGIKQRKALNEELIELKKPFGGDRELTYHEVINKAQRNGLEIPLNVQASMQKDALVIAPVENSKDQSFFAVLNTESLNKNTLKQLQDTAVYLDDHDLFKYNNPTLKAGYYLERQQVENFLQNEPILLKTKEALLKINYIQEIILHNKPEHKKSLGM